MGIVIGVLLLVFINFLKLWYREMWGCVGEY